MEKNIIKELLKRPVALNPIFIKITGRIGDGYLLSQIMYWYFSRDKDNGQEFFKTDSSWMEELYFSRRELETSKKSLLSLKFIEINKKGKGNKSYYTFCSDNVYEAILTIKGKAKKQIIHKTSFTQNEQTSSFAQNEQLGLHKTSIEVSTNCANPIYNDTESTTENKTEIILTKVNIEQSSENFDLGNLENGKNETQEEINSLSHELKGPSGAGDEENEEFGNKEINAILKLLCKAVGIDEFKETQQRQRIYGKHFVNWIKNNGKQEFLNRLKGVLSDGFKAKNANSIAYLYHEIKSFIHSPVVTPVDTNKKPITFG